MGNVGGVLRMMKTRGRSRNVSESILHVPSISPFRARVYYLIIFLAYGGRTHAVHRNSLPLTDNERPGDTSSQ